MCVMFTIQDALKSGWGGGGKDHILNSIQNGCCKWRFPTGDRGISSAENSAFC